MAFVWDPEKDEKNFQRHRIHLTTAEPIFDDPLRIKRRDDDSSVTEERYQTIGKAGSILFTVYTEEGDEDIRLITARIADPKERRIYYGARNAGTAYPFGWERADS